jgi:uncharacterized membrane protein
MLAVGNPRPGRLGVPELYALGRICPYCTSVHIITFILFSLVVFDAAGTKPARPKLS